MISLLRGRIVERTLGHVVIDVGGVGYGVTVPLGTYYKLAEAKGEVELRIHTHARDGVLALYGFLTDEEKRVFMLLIGVSGIGPKAAVNILSNVEPRELIDSIAAGDLRRRKIPGIGPKTAARLEAELKDKVASLVETSPADSAAAGRPLLGDVLSALQHLGYKRAEIERKLNEIESACAGARDVEDAVRGALRVMRSHASG